MQWGHLLGGFQMWHWRVWTLKNFRDCNNDVAMDQWNLLFSGAPGNCLVCPSCCRRVQKSETMIQTIILYPEYNQNQLIGSSLGDLSPCKRSHCNSKGGHDSPWMTLLQKSKRTRSRFRTREWYIKSRGKKKVKEFTKVWWRRPREVRNLVCSTAEQKA